MLRHQRFPFSYREGVPEHIVARPATCCHMPGTQYQKYAHTRNMAACCWRRPRSDTFDVPRFRTPYDRKTIHAEKSYGCGAGRRNVFCTYQPWRPIGSTSRTSIQFGHPDVWGEIIHRGGARHPSLLKFLQYHQGSSKGRTSKYKYSRRNGGKIGIFFFIKMRRGSLL